MPLVCPHCGNPDCSAEGFCLRCGGRFQFNIPPAGEVNLPAYGLPRPIHSGAFSGTPLACEIWHYGRHLVCSKGVVLPDVCVKCNQPASHRKKQVLVWYPKWILFFFVIPIIGLGLMAFNIQRETVEFGVCDRHWRKQLLVSFVSACLVVGGTAGVIFEMNIGLRLIPFLLWGGTFLVGAGIGVWAGTNMLLRPRKINDFYIWIDGTCEAYRERFPSA